MITAVTRAVAEILVADVNKSLSSATELFSRVKKPSAQFKIFFVCMYMVIGNPN